MDTTTSIKMTTLAIQNLFGYVEEENLAALKAHLDRFKEVDGRSDVRDGWTRPPQQAGLRRVLTSCVLCPDRMARRRSC